MVLLPTFIFGHVVHGIYHKSMVNYAKKAGTPELVFLWWYAKSMSRQTRCNIYEEKFSGGLETKNFSKMRIESILNLT